MYLICVELLDFLENFMEFIKKKENINVVVCF